MSVVLLAGLAGCASPATSQQEALSGPVAAALTTESKGSSAPTLDLGSTDPTQVVSVSIVFKVSQLGDLESFVAASQDPRAPSYHRFLSVAQFASRYAPSAHDVARVTAYLTANGIQVSGPLADGLVLKATGTVGAFTKAFTFDMHDFSDGTHHYHRPTGSPHLPGALSDVMLVVTGFSTQPMFKPMSQRASATAPIAAPKVVLPTTGTSTGVPGSYTVGDFADHYGVDPLYQAGIDGTGSTIGIATMANFYPADAYNYWSSIGLQVSQSRITQIHLDGGAPLSSTDGSGETSLDVEQSGGVAPGANLVVYDAPNTDGGFLDLFYNAASDNRVDSLSVSWGSPEAFYFNSVLTGGDYTANMNAFHQAFLELAAQGIAVFASSGDSGAYDAAGSIPGLSNELTIDVPGSDPAITAAGGTTLPLTVNAGPGTPDLVVAQEQVWGWDYVQNYLVANFGSQYAGALFPVGSGGGVSSYWSVPAYQRDLPGRRFTEAGQVFTYTSGTTTQTVLTLPTHFAGRNVPDVSANADPYSGYLVYSTADGGWLSGYGGTSFVAPQLNGVAALLKHSLGGRVGLLNAALYRSAQNAQSTGAIVDIAAGDNWFYSGVAGYEPAAGLGVLNVSVLAAALVPAAPCH